MIQRVRAPARLNNEQQSAGVTMSFHNLAGSEASRDSHAGTPAAKNTLANTGAGDVSRLDCQANALASWRSLPPRIPYTADIA